MADHDGSFESDRQAAEARIVHAVRLTASIPDSTPQRLWPSDAGFWGSQGHDHDPDLLLEAAEEITREDLLADDILLTLRDVMFLAALSESTVRKYLSEGTIPGFRLGDEWRVSLRFFREWVAERSGEDSQVRLCVHGFGVSHWLRDLTERCAGPGGPGSRG